MPQILPRRSICQLGNKRRDDPFKRGHINFAGEQYEKIDFGHLTAKTLHGRYSASDGKSKSCSDTAEHNW